MELSFHHVKFEKRSVYFFLILFFKLYIIVLVLPNIKMNLPQVYMCFNLNKISIFHLSA